jgi:hypothetical protein
MNISDLAERLIPDRHTILPVTRWVGAQFRPVIRRRQVETSSVPLPLFQTISEAHVSEREAAFGRHVASFQRIKHPARGRALPHDYEINPWRLLT